MNLKVINSKFLSLRKKTLEEEALQTTKSETFPKPETPEDFCSSIATNIIDLCIQVIECREEYCSLFEEEDNRKIREKFPRNWSILNTIDGSSIKKWTYHPRRPPSPENPLNYQSVNRTASRKEIDHSRKSSKKSVFRKNKKTKRLKEKKKILKSTNRAKKSNIFPRKTKLALCENQANLGSDCLETTRVPIDTWSRHCISMTKPVILAPVIFNSNK